MSDAALASPPSGLQRLRIGLDGSVATVVLDDPEARHALGPDMVGELRAALAWLAQRGDVRAVVLTGAGRDFCAGGDVGFFRERLRAGDGDLASEFRRGGGALNDVVLGLRRLPYPTLAAINGHAQGAGLSLALACDVRLMSSRAALTFAYGRLGAAPDAGMTWFLPGLVGAGRARALLIEDPVVRAPRALEEGLVTEVTPPEELADRAARRARQLAARSPHYVAAVKRLLDGAPGRGLAEQLDHEREAMADAMATEDFAHGLEALFAGRRPVFTGR